MPRRLCFSNTESRPSNRSFCFCRPSSHSFRSRRTIARLQRIQPTRRIPSPLRWSEGQKPLLAFSLLSSRLWILDSGFWICSSPVRSMLEHRSNTVRSLFDPCSAERSRFAPFLRLRSPLLRLLFLLETLARNSSIQFRMRARMLLDLATHREVDFLGIQRETPRPIALVPLWSQGRPLMPPYHLD